MAEIEDLINSLPFDVFQEHEHQCDCGQKYTKKHKYELEIKLLQYYTIDGEPAHRYLIYYICRDFSIGSSNRFIGRAVGMGQATLKEAIEELKGYINE